MRILGIDPGVGRVGWGIIDKHNGTWEVGEFGCIQTSPSNSRENRLVEVFTEVKELINAFHPDIAGVEKLFFQNNAKTAMEVGQARGVIILALTLRRVPITEVTPLQVKQAVTGYGKATKQQVQKMITTLLHLSEVPQPDDTADALAVALAVSAIGVPSRIG